MKVETLNFQAILNGIDDGVFVCDAKGNILMVNKSVEKTGGKRMDELIGRNIDDLLEEEYCSEFVTKKVITTKEKTTIIQKLNDGREFLVTGIPCFENNELVMVIACERDITELASLQEKLIESENLNNKYQNELELLRTELPRLKNAIYASEKMGKVVVLAEKVAKIDSTVLIQGESGAGKEIIAEHIYENSNRKGKPYITVNCGAIPENLLESEMLGYAAGAFTGALRSGKIGYFEMANGGTIFLDEIGEMPLNLQVKLLRVIQERNIMRIGGTATIPLDIRIIVATNKKLKELVKTGEFRKDLFYRLNVTTINVPPLRERKDDVIALSKFFLDKFNKRHNLNKKLSPYALKFLIAYEWPGNVRELENLMESLVITSETESISFEDVNQYLFDEVFEEALSLQTPVDSLERMVEGYEKQILQEAYQKFKDTGLMAKALKTTRSTINRKVKKYEIR